jgi:hypothetical protein
MTARLFAEPLLEQPMFGFLKRDPLKTLRKHYAETLEKAMHCQRNGDIRQYSMLTEQAEQLYRQIRELESGQAGS